MDDLEKGTSPGTAASRENAPSVRQHLKNIMRHPVWDQEMHNICNALLRRHAKILNPTIVEALTK